MYLQLVHVLMIVYVRCSCTNCYLLFLCYVVNYFSYIFSNIIMLVSELFRLLYKCVSLSNTSREKHLFLEINHSRGCGETPMCLKLVNISIPLLLFWLLKGPEGSYYNNRGKNYRVKVDQICLVLNRH